MVSSSLKTEKRNFEKKFAVFKGKFNVSSKRWIDKWI